jgi:hypothetical protein
MRILGYVNRFSEEVLITGIISPMNLRQLIITLLVIFVLSIIPTSCSPRSPDITSTPSQVQVTNTTVSSPVPSATPVPPTSTPIPMAVIVNEEGITQQEYQAELTRYQDATVITGTNLATDTGTIVLNELIDQTLLAQGASESGYIVDDALVQSRIEELESQLGSAQALTDWQINHGYTEDTFKVALSRAIGAAWMRDKITSDVPETADQVHVLQILVTTQSEADQVYADIQAG